MQGCKLRAARQQAARLQVAGLQAARLKAASCKVAGCKGAGDRLRNARLQAAGLQSESAILLRFDMQKTLHLTCASPCNEQNLLYIQFSNPQIEPKCCE